MSGMASTSRPPVRVSAQQEAYLAIARTEAALSDALEARLKGHGLSRAQYNVLRILRGAGSEGLCRNEIRDRLLSRMPDVTRLLDRMEEAGWLARERRADDRRQVATRLTPAGRALVDRLDPVIDAEHRARFAALSPAELDTLQRLLARVRDGA